LALASFTVPEVSCIVAHLIVDTLAFARIVVPDKVVKARFLFADAFSGGHVEDLVLAFAVLR